MVDICEIYGLDLMHKYFYDQNSVGEYLSRFGPLRSSESDKMEF